MPQTLDNPLPIDATFQRCSWCESSDLYRHYHDHEWGLPVADERRLFEKICLEGFQSGLSWITILRKREAFRAAFAQFDINAIARFTEHDIERLMQNADIVRHRGKIEAVINNAKAAITLLETEPSLAAYLWRFAPPAQVPSATPIAQNEQSQALSKDLKRRGWKFVGPTTMYALMQAMGMVNDHAVNCVIRSKAEQARANFNVPS